jgi:hypothetical protein
MEWQTSDGETSCDVCAQRIPILGTCWMEPTGERIICNDCWKQPVTEIVCDGCVAQPEKEATS